MHNIYSMASSSASTTYSNVMAFIKEIILKYLPIIEFKDVNLASEIASVNVRRRLGRNKIIEISKLERPNMNITPRIEVPSGDVYLFDIPLTKNYNHIEYGVDSHTLFWILKNVDDGYFFTYKMNRDRISFDVEINVDTMIQQTDLWKYMLNWFTWDRPYTITTSLESMIPRQLVRHMGLLSNIDIDNPDSNQVPAMLQMMNRLSRYPITYKMRNGTANDEFYMYYTANVLVNFYDLQVDGVTRKNFADDFYQVRFSCTADFNLPGLYALLGVKPPPKIIIEDLRVKEPNGDHDLIPLFTVDNIFNRYPSVRNGYVFHTTCRVKTDAGNKLSDTVNIGSLFDDWRIEVIQQFNNTHTPMDTLIQIIVLKNGKELTEDKDFRVTWHTLDLEIFNADDKATYQLIIYVNNNTFTTHEINAVETYSTDKPRL